jgi:hypothetical protein
MKALIAFLLLASSAELKLYIRVEISAFGGELRSRVGRALATARVLSQRAGTGHCVSTNQPLDSLPFRCMRQ